MTNKKTRWILIGIVAAVVAAATTVLVLVLRARAKKKAWYEEQAFDYDLDDCACFDCEDEDCPFSDDDIDGIIEE